MSNRIRWITETGLLTAFITVTGAIKLPGLFPGTEFQLSAPLAVAICVVFGFTKYITAGTLSSLIGLILGTQNLLNVFIALIFRLTIGCLLAALGTTWPIVVIAGPVGSAIARLFLSGAVGKAAVPLLLAAVPGMVYTAFVVWPLTLMLNRIKEQTERMSANALQR